LGVIGEELDDASQRPSPLVGALVSPLVLKARRSAGVSVVAVEAGGSSGPSAAVAGSALVDWSGSPSIDAKGTS
jgi:hypothetical protein